MKKTVFKIICIVIAIACLGAAGFLAYKNGLINTDKLKNAFRKNNETTVSSVSISDETENIITEPTDEEIKPVESVISGPKEDRTNLYPCTDYVEFEGFACSEIGNLPNGFEIPESIFEAIQPGTVLEIEYTSKDGEMWIVFPWANDKGAVIGKNDDYLNNTHTIAQITYEQIVKACGENKDNWGKILQCCSSSDWEVTSLKVGTVGSAKVFRPTAIFDGYVCSAEGLGQAGYEMPDKIFDALIPGSVIRISYTSEDDSMWIVFPWATEWTRVGETDSDNPAVIDGSLCYITYEQIVERCGEDKSAWGSLLQCESNTKWAVSSLEVGYFEQRDNRMFKPGVEYEGFNVEATGYEQKGVDITPEVLSALVPGSVVRIQYTSEDGAMWLVIPWAESGWSRIGRRGTLDEAYITGSTCYITFEQIAAVCGEDPSTWGPTIQAESSSDWHVTSVNIGEWGDAMPKLRGQKILSSTPIQGAGEIASGFALDEDDLDSFVPGTYLKIDYTSEDGSMWVVMPWTKNGSVDIGLPGSTSEAFVDDTCCLISYEHFAAACGEDKSTWGNMIQFTSNSDWTVTSVSIGRP